MKENEYQCAICKGIFECGWTDEEAKAEADKNFGAERNHENDMVICDDCFKELMPTIQN